MLFTTAYGQRSVKVLMISAVCGRAPPLIWPPKPEPDPPLLPDTAHDWLSVTKTRGLSAEKLKAETPSIRTKTKIRWRTIPPYTCNLSTLVQGFAGDKPKPEGKHYVGASGGRDFCARIVRAARVKSTLLLNAEHHSAK